MTENEKNILQKPELKNMPYSLPEGYFEKFKSEARKSTEPRYVPVNLRSRLAPYIGIAAMFLFILVLGKIFVRPTPTAEISTTDNEIAVVPNVYEDYLVFSDMSSDISMHYIEEDGFEQTELSEEDIIEYLIYIGATEEYIEYTNE
jgi:hypothetical protein